MPAESNIAFMREFSMPDTFPMTLQAFPLSSVVPPVEAMSMTEGKQGDSKMAASHSSVVAVSSTLSIFASSYSRSMARSALSPPLRNGSTAGRSPGSSATTSCCCLGRCLTITQRLSRPATRCS